MPGHPALDGINGDCTLLRAQIQSQSHRRSRPLLSLVASPQPNIEKFFVCLKKLTSYPVLYQSLELAVYCLPQCQKDASRVRLIAPIVTLRSNQTTVGSARVFEVPNKPLSLLVAWTGGLIYTTNSSHPSSIAADPFLVSAS